MAVPSFIFFNSLSPKYHSVKLVPVLQQRCWKFCPLTYLLCVLLPVTWLSDSPDSSCSPLLVMIYSPCRQIHILNHRLMYVKSAATDYIRNNSNWICQKKCTYGCCFLPCKTHAVNFISRFLQWQQPSRTFTIVENPSNIGSVSIREKKWNGRLKFGVGYGNNFLKRNLLLSNNASCCCPFFLAML